MIQIDACKQGDKDALGELYTVYAHKLEGVCRHYIKDESVAEDILHDAFIIIFMSLKDVKDNSQLEGWMITIVRNLSLKYLKSTDKRNFPLSQLDIDFAVDESSDLDKSIELEVLLSAIENLPKGNREVFKLSVLDGLSHKEIGKLLGIAPHSSSSQLFRAKKMLRTMLIDYWEVMLLPVFIPLYFYFITKNQCEKKSGSSFAFVKSRKEDTRESGTLENNTNILNNTKTTDSLKKKNSNYFAQERTDEQYAKIDTTNIIGIENKDVEQHVMALNTDSLQKYLAVESNVTDSLFRLPSISSDKLVALNTHGYPSTSRQKKYPWTFNLGYSSNAASNATLPNLGYLSVVDYANGGAMAKLYTWEDYSNYLTRNKALMDSVERAKMEWIAQNNATDGNAMLDEKAHHYRPKTLGISLNKQLSPNWIFGTGLTYTRLKSEFTSEYHKAKLIKIQKIDYVGMPLRLTYRIWGKGRFNAYTTGGVTFEMPVHSSFDKKYVVTSDSTFTLRGDIKPRYQLSVNLGIGVQYKIFKPFSLYFEPNMFYYFGNGSGIETYRTEHPFFITVPFGLRLTW